MEADGQIPKLDVVGSNPIARLHEWPIAQRWAIRVTGAIHLNRLRVLRSFRQKTPQKKLRRFDAEAQPKRRAGPKGQANPIARFILSERSESKGGA